MDEFNLNSESQSGEENKTYEVTLGGEIKKSIDNLSAYWEVRDRREVIVWAIQLFDDLTKLDQDGWHPLLVKPNGKNPKNPIESDYQYVSMPLDFLRPREGKSFRLDAAAMEKFIKEGRG